MNPNYEKFLRKLHELFMLDQEDLDFGIYRIMNYRRDEIKQFLDRDLLTQVRAELATSGNVDRQATQRKLDAAIKQAQELGVDPETTQKVKDLLAELAQAGNAEALENEVFSQLYNFFSRYYEGGDFVSLRRYKKDVYAIPYEGEEVKLYWANADQYYIKSSEYFKKYRFTLPDGKAVEFTLRDASTEQLNNKSTGNTERRFRLVDEAPLEVYGNTLRIYFNYLPVDKSLKREALNKEAHDRLTPLLPAAFVQALAPPSGKSSHKTLLEKHLNHYTARHAFDYFIHKDLGGFLNRELDFFIKNELLDIDEIDTQADAQQHMAIQFAKIVALKKIARKIIAFLASLEDFQRSLWLKKKFVTEAQYCLTLDRVPAELYPEIAANERQADEWVVLVKIDQIGKDATNVLFQKTPYTRPLTVQFLEENPFLVLDTAHFDTNFKMRLLAHLPHLDEQTDGLLLHSDNFQALAFLQERYREQVKSVYIDPPYNTNSTPILYKNEFKHSSWISLVADRLELSKNLMNSRGTLTVAIDDAEFINLSFLLEMIYPEYRVSKITVVHNPKGSITKDFNRVHEYCIFLTSDSEKDIIARTLEENDTPRKMRRWGENSLRTERRLSFYPIFVKNGKIVRVGKVPDDSFHPSGRNVNMENGEIAIYPIDQDGVERRWNFGLDTINKNLDRVIIQEVDGILDLFVTHELSVPKTVWTGGDYDAGNHGNSLLISMLGDKKFDFPKSINLVFRCIYLSTANDSNATILDYFGGSGTTAHAVLNLNREDGGRRKYILVEQGEYFDTVLLPRIKKVVYSKDWKNGAPQSRDTGVSHCLKYLRLESYEDTLNNLTLERSPAQQQALDTSPGFRERYLLQYAFAAESRASLAGADAFLNPFDKRLRLLRQNEEREVVVDVVETFNYLLGLVVESTYAADGFRVVTGKLLPDPAGRELSVLIVWRNCHEKSAEDLNAFFDRQKFSPRDREFNRIYVNGDHTLQNVLDADHGPKVTLIEGEFRRRMFKES
jgi:adenine-specific DNA-methyltransferase